MFGFTIFVPGGKRGMQCKILIEKISGGVAFARIQPT
jgi:predicted RNA-binding protein with TRAM domain